MRFILDTNQITSILKTIHLIEPKVRRQTTIVLPPLVLAEIALGSHAAERTACLAEFNVRFGIEFRDFFESITRMSDAQIANYEPIIPKGARHIALKQSLLRVPSDFDETAQKVKSHCRDALMNAEHSIRQANKTNRDNISRGYRVEYEKKCASSNEATDRHGITQANALWQLLVGQSNCECRFANPESLFDSISWNPFASRFHRVFDSIVLGWVGLWSDEKLNVSVNPNRNDLTDIVNTLYLGDGDVLLTADKKLKEALEHSETGIEQCRRVRVASWTECMRLYLS